MHKEHETYTDRARKIQIPRTQLPHGSHAQDLCIFCAPCGHIVFVGPGFEPLTLQLYRFVGPGFDSQVQPPVSVPYNPWPMLLAPTNGATGGTANKKNLSEVKKVFA